MADSNDFAGFKSAAEQSEFEKFKASSEEPGFFADMWEGVKSGGYNLGSLLIEAHGGDRRERREAPESLGGRMGEVLTESVAMGAPLGAAASRIPRAEQGVVRSREIVQNALNEMGVAFKRSPGRFLATEAALGASAGAGGYLAQQMYPDSAAARFTGEIIGGSLLSVTEAAGRGAANLAQRMPLSGWVINTTRQGLDLTKPLTTQRRMSQRVDRATADRPGAAAAMEDELLPGLTPAARTGDTGLMRMETSVNQELDDADKFIETSVNEVQRNIRNAIAEFEGNPEATIRTFENARNELIASLDARLIQAARRTEQTLLDIRPGASRETVNNIASGELRSALSDARTQERALYELIPDDAIVPTNSAQNVYRDLKASLSQAEIDDLPSVAKKFLEPDSGSFLGAQTDIKEIRGLQSKLRQEARNARSGDGANLNRARIADLLADAITDDIGNTAGGEAVSGAVRAAVDYSRTLNDKFRKGTVGTLLGFARQGEIRTQGGLILERSIGLSGANARQAFDDIVNATHSPEVKTAMSDFIKNKFMDFSVRNGELNRSAAQSFMRVNREVLGRMPDVERALRGAIDSLDVQDLRASQRARVNLQSPSVSRATMFIERSPERAFNQIMIERNPAREMTNLVNMARRDTTGEAFDGLKSAYSQFISGKATLPNGTVSGAKLEEFLTNPNNKKAMSALYTGEELKRWDIISETAKRLDLQRAATGASEGVIGDRPGATVTLLARLLGARSGTSIARATGTGGIQMQAIMSDRFRDLLKRGIDPSKRLIMDAVQDETLFKELLLAEVKPNGSISEPARRRMNAWVATLLLPDEEEPE